MDTNPRPSAPNLSDPAECDRVMALRGEWVTAGRPLDHEYMRIAEATSAAMLSGPAVGFMTSTGLVTIELTDDIVDGYEGAELLR